MIQFEVPIKTQCSLNNRMHPMKRARLVKAERTAVRLIAMQHMPGGRIPASIKMTRKYSGTMPDDDNLRGLLKGARDSLAAVCGINDNDPRVVWQYGQVKAKRADFGIVIEVRYVD